MNVVLTRPSYNTHIISPPIGMGYVASYLKKHGHNTIIIDGLNLDLSNEEIVRRCEVLNAKLIGIYILSAYLLNAVDLIKKLHAKGFKVVLGGAHPTFMPKFVGVCGAPESEGCIGMLSMINCLKSAKILPI